MYQQVATNFDPVEDEVKQVVELYKNVYQSATSVISAFIRKSQSIFPRILQSIWSQRNLERGIKVKLRRTSVFDEKSGLRDTDTIDVSHWELQSFSHAEEFQAIISISNKSSCKAEYEYFLEIWDTKKVFLFFNLASLDIHGIVYTDDIFGSLSWSHGDNKVAYIAERKPLKTAPFYPPKVKNECDTTKTQVGEQFVYEDDWGEQMTSKRNPIIAVCCLEQKNITILNGLPVDISPGQIIWEPNDQGVVGVGVCHEPRRLGIKFCSNRESCIFHLTLDEKYTVLSDQNMSVTSPRFSPDGETLVWLQRPRGGPHNATRQLVACDWNTKEVSTVVDIIQTEIMTANDKFFYGIYCNQLPIRCWTLDSKYILLSTYQTHRINSYAINSTNGKIWDIGCDDEDVSTIIHDVTDGLIIAEMTSFKLAPVLVYSAKFNLTEPFSICWSLPEKSANAKNEIISRFTVYDTNTNDKRCYATYYGPAGSTLKSTPMILFMHGGPHSNTPSVFTPLFEFFIRNGFGNVIVNYRGSTGCGEVFLQALLGNIGRVDVSDCHLALINALSKFPWLDPANVMLFGGSHGGFLVTLLSSRHSNDFKAVVARNPVIVLPAKVFTTDIPDFCVSECGYEYGGIGKIIQNTDLWKKMAEVSPLRYVDKVEAPTLLLLGKRDVRVPHSQGLSYYYALKERNVQTKVLFYDDNHSLSSVAVEMDSTINAMLWFNKYTKCDL